MKFWVGVTDNDWFRHLAARQLDEVNFWQPSATAPFRNASVGMPFLFKLKRPHHHIGGGGAFVTYSTLPLALAWEVFGEKNGAATLDELRAMLDPLTSRRDNLREIGCTVLANVFYLPQGQWIADPPGFANPIVRGKMYETETPEGASIWRDLTVRLSAARLETGRPVADPLAFRESTEAYGEPVVMRPRLGQSSFRVLVTDAYNRRCAITGENTLAVLEAAHIVPYSTEGSHDVRNGLLLRADFHRLFDAGLVSVTPDLRVRVSPRIRESWFNGRVYYRLNDQPLTVLPASASDQPDRDRLSWHFKNCFQA
jgi:putative restriction endonuclease